MRNTALGSQTVVTGFGGQVVTTNRFPFATISSTKSSQNQKSGELHFLLEKNVPETKIN